MSKVLRRQDVRDGRLGVKRPLGTMALLAVSLFGCTRDRDAPKEVIFFVAEPKPGFGFSQAELVLALEEADRAWRRGCSDYPLPTLRFRPSDLAEPVIRDGRNVIRAVTGRFCPDGARDTSDCYEARRAAITHSYPPLDGTRADYVSRFPEFDIELNGADFRWKELGREKLLAILVHELGHVFGLKHSCKFPECDEEASRAVMYPYPLESDRTLLLSPTRADCDALARLR